MKSFKTIIANLFFNNSLNSRSAVKLLFENIGNHDNVVIDMQKIDFISRAAAHELVVQIEKNQLNGIDITLENLTKEVNLMLDNVSTSRQSNVKKATFVKHIHFSSENDLISYLESV